MNFIKGAVKKKTEAYISELDCCVFCLQPKEKIQRKTGKKRKVGSINYAEHSSFFFTLTLNWYVFQNLECYLTHGFTKYPVLGLPTFEPVL